MKHKPMEPSTELLYELCTNINEDMKYVLSEICDHNRHYPKNKITLEYEKGSSVATISDENKDGEVTFFRDCRKGVFSYQSVICLIKGYGYGLNAAGIRKKTPKEL